jgi:hypothetical protein
VLCYTLRSESRCALRLRYVDLLSVSKLPMKFTVVSLYSVVKQRLKCNTVKYVIVYFGFYSLWFFQLRNVFYKCTATLRTHCTTQIVCT